METAIPGQDGWIMLSQEAKKKTSREDSERSLRLNIQDTLNGLRNHDPNSPISFRECLKHYTGIRTSLYNMGVDVTEYDTQLRDIRRLRTKK